MGSSPYHLVLTLVGRPFSTVADCDLIMLVFYLCRLSDGSRLYSDECCQTHNVRQNDSLQLIVLTYIVRINFIFACINCVFLLSHSFPFVFLISVYNFHTKSKRSWSEYCNAHNISNNYNWHFNYNNDVIDGDD